MDIKTLKDMTQNALSALDSFESGIDSEVNKVFEKVRASADICIDNNDLHPFLKNNIELTKQYEFKTAAFGLRNLSSLTGGRGRNPLVRKYLLAMNSAYDSILSHSTKNEEKNIGNMKHI